MPLQDIRLGVNQNEDPITIGDSEYELPLKPYIRFMDRDNNTNYQYDAFQPDNGDFKLNSLSATNGIGDTGSVNIEIEDSSRDLDESLINWGNKFIIKIAKNQWEYSYPHSTFLIGYVKGYRKERPATGVLIHHMRVQGSKVIFNERKINYKRSTDSNSNTSFLIKNHIKSLIRNPLSYPINTQTIEEQSGFDLSGIDTNLNTMLKTVNFEMLEAGNAIERLANIEGARWFVDFVGEKEIVTVKHPTELHTGVVIKSGDLLSMDDPALYTSHFKGNWDADGDITGSTGFANRLYTKTQIDRKEFTSSFVNQGSTSLANKALAQKFFITETRITDLAFLLSKVGEPTSQNNRVNGRIIADNNNSPTGNIISSFNIPLSSIEKTPETIFVNDLDIRNRFVTNAAPAWIVLYQRSGTDEVNKSEPNTDESNTIRWHHNNDTTTTTDKVSKVAASGDRDDNLVWNFNSSSTTGPTYGFGVFARIRHIQEVADRGSINRYGLVEAEVNTSFLEEPDVIQMYLEALLAYSSKPRLVFGTRSVKPPSQFLFKPYQTVTLIDSLAFPNGIDAEIQNVTYNFSSQNHAWGCRSVDITPMAYYDYLDDQFKC